MKLAGAVITSQSGIKCEPQSGDTGFCNSLPRAGGPGRCRCQTLVPTDRRRLCVPIPSGGTADHSPALRRLLRNPNCEDLGGKRMTKPPQQSSPQGGTINSPGRKSWVDVGNELRAPRGRHDRDATQILAAAMMIRRKGRDGWNPPGQQLLRPLQNLVDIWLTPAYARCHRSLLGTWATKHDSAPVQMLG